jgi:hypothetical protein
MSPMQLHRTYGQCHSDIVDLDWSPDSQFIAVASQDIVARWGRSISSREGAGEGCYAQEVGLGGASSCSQPA